MNRLIQTPYRKVYTFFITSVGDQISNANYQFICRPFFRRCNLKREEAALLDSFFKLQLLKKVKKEISDSHLAFGNRLIQRNRHERQKS